MENFTPISPALMSQAPITPEKSSFFKNKRLMFLLAAPVLMMVIGVSFFYLGNRISNTPRAAVPACHTGSPPLPLDQRCDTTGSVGRDDELGCPAPEEGSCKRKGACFECRYRFEGLRMICPCTTEPTVPVQQFCQAPNSCLEPSQCDINTPPSTNLSCSVPGTVCCTPKKPSCEAPKSCVDNPNNLSPDRLCQAGSFDPLSGRQSCGDQAICCQPVIPTITNTPSLTPVACIPPKLNVQVECLTCNQQP